MRISISFYTTFKDNAMNYNTSDLSISSSHLILMHIQYHYLII